jgi:TonB family protein
MRPETTAAPAPVSDPELDLYRQSREEFTPLHWLYITAGSVVIHILAVAGFLALPEVERNTVAPLITPDLSKATRIYAPRFFEPTQTAPNTGKVSRDLDVRSAEPAPRPQAPHFRAPQPVPGPIAAALPPAPVAEAPKIEQPRVQQPPKIEAAATPPQPPAISANPLATAPPPPTAPAKPKLAFESIGASQSHVQANPNAVIPDPHSRFLNPASDTPPGAGGTIVGDVGASNRTIPSSNQAPSPGRPGSNLQLLSDAKGVDFRPYLIQVLQVVRRNWLAIMPESARLGQRGKVLIQFAIDRNGAVPKVVIAEGAGLDVLDRAAVAAISASYPFPPLPGEYKGDEIRLQFAFSYNMPAGR